MSGIKKIKKDDIIMASLEILRESNFDNIQARTIAKKLNCSTQPIFYQFNSMDEIKSACLNEATNIYKKHILEITNKKRPYREMGSNYLKFAKEEPQIFKLIFMSNHNTPVENFMTNDKSYKAISRSIEIQTGLKPEYIKDFHLKMWMFTHGIACLIATDTCDFTYEQIDKLLYDEFMSLMLLEKELGHIKGVN